MTQQQQDWARVCESTGALVTGPAEATIEIQKKIEETNGYEFEHLIAVFLTNQSRVVGTAVVGIGGFTGSSLIPAVLFKKFFTTPGAVSIILGHNHPSGDLTPSVQDQHFAHELDKIAKTLNVTILDHLVVTHAAYTRITKLAPQWVQ